MREMTRFGVCPVTSLKVSAKRVRDMPAALARAGSVHTFPGAEKNAVIAFIT
jgi:hypothetical protein